MLQNQIAVVQLSILKDAEIKKETYKAFSLQNESYYILILFSKTTQTYAILKELTARINSNSRPLQAQILFFFSSLSL